jgi:phytoene desaturase
VAEQSAAADVVVVGAGLAGLAAAACLARAGRAVVCLEAQPQPGGQCATLAEDGFTVDLGPPAIFDRAAVEEAFAAAGARLDAHVRLEELDPAFGVVFPDWERVLFHRSVERTAQELERLCAGDGERYGALMAWLEMVEPDLAALRARPPRGGLRDALSAERRRHPLFHAQSLRAFLAGRLTGARAVEALSSLVRLDGQEPDAAPAPAAAAALRALHRGGAWQVAGGSARLAAGLAAAARGAGVDLRLGAPVAQILVDGGRAAGVRLASGETIAARAVVATPHAGAVYGALLGDGAPRRAARAVAGLEMVGAPLQVAFGFQGDDVPDLALQFYVPPAQEREDALSRLRGADDVYLKGLFMAFACPSVLDPDVAPEDVALARAIVPVPYRQALAEWRRLRDRCADEAIAFADSRFLPGMRDRVCWRGVFTPQATGGLLGLWHRSTAPALTVAQRGTRRPALRSPYVGGLYLAGRSTHPGPGTADALRSGLGAAALVQRDS